MRYDDDDDASYCDRHYADRCDDDDCDDDSDDDDSDDDDDDCDDDCDDDDDDDDDDHDDDDHDDDDGYEEKEGFTVEGGGTVHVLRSVLEVPLSIVLIHRGVDGDGLCVDGMDE
jgi:hypothetical protein